MDGLRRIKVNKERKEKEKEKDNRVSEERGGTK